MWSSSLPPPYCGGTSASRHVAAVEMVFRCIYVLQCAGTSSKTQGSNDYLTTWSVRSTHFKACFLAAVYFIQQILRVSHAWHVVLFLLPSYFLAWQVTLAGTHPLIQKMADHNMPIPRLGLAFCTGFGKLHLHRFVFPSTSFAKPGHNVERFPSSLVSGPRNNTLIKLTGSDVFFPQLNSSFVYIYISIIPDSSNGFSWQVLDTHFGRIADTSHEFIAQVGSKELKSTQEYPGHFGLAAPWLTINHIATIVGIII